METYLTVEGLAGYLKFAEQTIRQWVQNNEVPYHKIRKGVRFRLSEIETWVDKGGLTLAAKREYVPAAGDLFCNDDTGKTAGVVDEQGDEMTGARHDGY